MWLHMSQLLCTLQTITACHAARASYLSPAIIAMPASCTTNAVARCFHGCVDVSTGVAELAPICDGLQQFRDVRVRFPGSLTRVLRKAEQLLLRDIVNGYVIERLLPCADVKLCGHPGRKLVIVARAMGP